jgi:hypothetical protein
MSDMLTCNIELRWWDVDGDVNIPRDARDQLVVDALEHLLEIDPDYMSGELLAQLDEATTLRGWWGKTYVEGDNNISAAEWQPYPDYMPSGPVDILIGYDKMQPRVCMATYVGGQCYDDEGGIFDPEEIMCWTLVPELPDELTKPAMSTAKQFASPEEAT